MDKIVNESKYKLRIIDSVIERNLKIFGAICIEGPKWCGKTWTSSYHAQSEFLVGDPTGNFSNQMLALMEPFSVLNEKKPRLIDEYQEVPSLWDATRAYVDKSNEKGQIILTGFSTPKTKGVMHSGTGRIKSIRMNTMSLFESKNSTGAISLEDLYFGKFETQILNNTTLEELAYLIVRGGWPGNLEISKKDCGLLAQSYMENILKTDLRSLDDEIEYNSQKAKLILKSLANNSF